MRFTETTLDGTFVVTADRHVDRRGTFLEVLRIEQVERATGRPFTPAQVNCSVSRRNVLRGIHSVTTPPGQAKFLTCLRGAVRDVVVDLREGSPTFGDHVTTHLQAGSGVAVLVPEGVGHGFLSLLPGSTVCYLLSTAHVPGTQVDIHPLDPDLALPWGFTEPPILSRKDAAAPGLAAVRASGALSCGGVRPTSARHRPVPPTEERA